MAGEKEGLNLVLSLKGREGVKVRILMKGGGDFGNGYVERIGKGQFKTE